MERNILIVLFLFLGCCTSNKSSNELLTPESRIESIQRRVNLLNHPSSIKYDTTGFSKLSGFNNNCDDENEHPWDYYSVVDLNKDGQNDLIYSGFCMPYSKTFIWVTEANRLLLLYQGAGDIISMESAGKQTRINVLNGAIGCISESYLTEIMIEATLPPVVHSIEYHVLPKKNFVNLTNIKVKGILRTSPRKDDVDHKDGCEQVFKGNQLESIEEEAEVIQLDQKGEWKLVLYDQNKFHSVIGWIQ
ncbi:MAG: hypothetical protein HYZ44_16425 [Bacteroidetes bacterium]|nr:hypothetical protein [Bacteroidota bacterium]